MSASLERVGEIVCDHLAQIAEQFKNPKITLIVRAPDIADGDMILTDDDLNATIAAIQRMQARKA